MAFSPRSPTWACWTCWRSTSSIWSPTLRIGLSAARGFWKIIEISRPRRSRICSSVAPLTSMPENITEPSAILPARSRMRITAYEVTDLPEPDSPTMPRVSPFATEMSTCCTAFTMPRRVTNSTVRSRTSGSGCEVIALRPPLRVDDVAQAVAEQVEAEHRDHQRQPRKQRDPPLARHHEAGAFRDHYAPFRGRRPLPETDERQASGLKDGVTDDRRHLLDHDRHDV